ncbi:xanthine dehydrogenase [Aureococcus anophagefferens]|nr:xanthine dehydrogenase [Aureococcus anophagefferens]
MPLSLAYEVEIPGVDVAAYDAAWASDPTITVNGEKRRVDASRVTGSTTLLDFLRLECGLTGAKLGCGEGGCGACTVVVSTWDVSARKPVHRSINGCLAALSHAGRAVTTAEGMGSAAAPHPIQSARRGPRLPLLRWFASTQIRNGASLGGNLATASPISDMNPLLAACRATVTVAAAGGARRDLDASSFFLGYRKTKLLEDEVIESIRVPYGRPLEFVRPYKQSRRREDDIAIVTSTLRVVLAERDGGYVVQEAAFAFGGLAATVKLADATANSSSRRGATPGAADRDPPGALDLRRRAEAVDHGRPGLACARPRGQGPRGDDLRHAPPGGGPLVCGVSKKHQTALLQVTGEARYTDDQPAPAETPTRARVSRQGEGRGAVKVDAAAPEKPPPVSIEQAIAAGSYYEMTRHFVASAGWDGDAFLDEPADARRRRRARSSLRRPRTRPPAVDSLELAAVAGDAFFNRIDLSAHGFYAVDGARCGYDWDRANGDRACRFNTGRGRGRRRGRARLPRATSSRRGRASSEDPQTTLKTSRARRSASSKALRAGERAPAPAPAPAPVVEAPSVFDDAPAADGDYYYLEDVETGEFLCGSGELSLAGSVCDGAAWLRSAPLRARGRGDRSAFESTPCGSYVCAAFRPGGDRSIVAFDEARARTLQAARSGPAAEERSGAESSGGAPGEAAERPRRRAESRGVHGPASGLLART